LTVRSRRPKSPGPRGRKALILMTPAQSDAHRSTTDADGRTLHLTHLSKPWWPGFTKGQALDYYRQIAPVMLPHLEARPASFIRAPDGAAGHRFVAKHVPRGAPEWVPRTTLHGKDGDREEVVVADLATLLWAANLGNVELHVPPHRRTPDRHDRLVLDLDPGPGIDLLGCCRVALLLREALEADGATGLLPVASGSKGLHLYAPIDATEEQAVGYAHALADRLAAAHPDTVTATMTKKDRPGHVLIDWSQNHSVKTTCSPYSLRLTPEPSVATPLTWDEVESAKKAADLHFTPSRLLERIAEHGDLIESLLGNPSPLPAPDA
jgi:bifunctional non-homologous end joining protein LigD